MKLIVGLGNPGEEYLNSRHNVGFVVLDLLNSKFQIRNSKQIINYKFKYQNKFQAEVLQVGKVLLMKPQTFMNRSGGAVQKVMQFYKIGVGDLWVVHDDLDICLGEYKIQLGKGPKVHNGVNSVEQVLGTKDFWRVRIGVENRGEILRWSGSSQLNKRAQDDKTSINSLDVLSNEAGEMIPGKRYVLSDFLEEEREVVDEVMEKVVGELMMRLEGN